MEQDKIKRKVDELGRIALPKELRDRLNIKEKDTVEVYIKDNRLVIDKLNVDE